MPMSLATAAPLLGEVEQATAAPGERRNLTQEPDRCAAVYGDIPFRCEREHGHDGPHRIEW